MKKITIALIIVASVIFTLSGCMATSHARHGGSNTSQHSGGCH